MDAMWGAVSYKEPCIEYFITTLSLYIRHNSRDCCVVRVVISLASKLTDDMLMNPGAISYTRASLTYRYPSVPMDLSGLA